MWVLIILFAIALISITVIFITAYWKIKTGKRIPTETRNTWIELRPDSIKSELKEQSRFYIHRLVLFLLKLWIRCAYFIRKQEQTVRTRLTSYLHSNAQKMNEGRTRPVSKFLKHISDHKEGTKTEDTDGLVK